MNSVSDLAGFFDIGSWGYFAKQLDESDCFPTSDSVTISAKVPFAEKHFPGYRKIHVDQSTDSFFNYIKIKWQEEKAAASLESGVYAS